MGLSRPASLRGATTVRFRLTAIYDAGDRKGRAGDHKGRPYGPNCHVICSRQSMSS